MSSSLDAFPSIAKGLIASGPSHLTSSLAQFLTRLDGHAITHFCIVDLPASGDCFNKVHINVMHCSCTRQRGQAIEVKSELTVLPRPISSAMIQPLAFSSINPVVA